MCVCTLRNFAPRTFLLEIKIVGSVGSGLKGSAIYVPRVEVLDKGVVYSVSEAGLCSRLKDGTVDKIVESVIGRLLVDSFEGKGTLLSKQYFGNGWGRGGFRLV